MKDKNMKFFLLSLGILSAHFVWSQSQGRSQDMIFEVKEADNAMFTHDPYWRGADGAASIDLENGQILWLFSDSFIDPLGTGRRTHAILIRNSIGIQEGHSLNGSKISFYYQGTPEKPKAFFELPGDTWLWTGHGILVKNKLILFLFEEKSLNTGIGFEAVNWYVAVIDNPLDDAVHWNIRYIRGPETLGVIVGSAAVLKDEEYVYAYGVKEPAGHEVYLLRFPIDQVITGDLSGIRWWNNNEWIRSEKAELTLSPLFTGQTEFSVHYQEDLHQYMEIQTYGWDKASIGYRLSERPEGPWSPPVIFYTPTLHDPQDFVYTANAHPEIVTDGLLITYNVNNHDFDELVKNEHLYFPQCLQLKFLK